MIPGANYPGERYIPLGKTFFNGWKSMFCVILRTLKHDILYRIGEMFATKLKIILEKRS